MELLLLLNLGKFITHPDSNNFFLSKNKNYNKKMKKKDQ